MNHYVCSPQLRRAGVLAAALVLALGVSARPAGATGIPYPDAGTYNATTYTFTAAADGEIVAYIVGGFGAGYENELGLLINGVDTGFYGLNNHTSSVGDSFNFNSVTVTAGDTLTFVLKNIARGASAYSDASLNDVYDGLLVGTNHVYSTAYTAVGPDPIFPGVPVGTYVAFEDLAVAIDGFSDFNYDDESFVFTNVASSASVPDSGSTMLLLSLGVASVARLRRGIRSNS